MASKVKISWRLHWLQRKSSVADAASLQKLDNDAFLDAVYLKYLGRNIDPTGKSFYLQRVQSSRGRQRVIQALQNSVEGQAYNQRQKNFSALLDWKEREQHSPTPYLRAIQNRKPPRIALLGTCQVEGLLQTALAASWPVKHYLMDSGPHDHVPLLSAEDFDGVLVQLTLRSLLSMVAENGDGDLFHLRADVDWSDLRERAGQQLQNQVQRILAALPDGLPVFFLGFLEPMPRINGLLGRNRQNSLYALIRHLNDALEEALAVQHRAFYLELNDLRLHYGDSTAYDGYVTHFTHGGMRSSRQGDLIHLGILEKVQAALQILRGDQQVKLIITDLDNTLWKGVLAELDEIIPLEVTEGWPLGYAEALLACKARGILLAICSKNEDISTRENFAKVWGSRLRLEDFCAVHISWQPKSQAIAQILAETNLLPEYVLFIDDNPLEIAEVSHAYPQMRTLSGDPEQWRHLLLYAVETQVAHVSAESARRTELVQAKKQRDAAAENMDRAAWLESLQLTLQVETVTDGRHPRYARALELLNKTNQFNTTGRRWSDAELQNWLAAGGVLLAVSTQDRFAPHGLIALALLQSNAIMQMVLSCRVFGLGIETALLAEAVRQIQAGGHDEFLGHFSATGRNDACRDFWPEQGLVWDAEQSLWRGSVAPEWPTWIRP
ncbi:MULTISPECIES: HAD-IIIC family phosphatase [Acidithiobacillus]|uniref:HAD-IIIC family phosphatase n=1 Tax=Acidithiobacillus TaxID=119977 RepID=UPI0009DA0FC2|nr:MULTISPECIES: HAD-IIIC family phosphatase [Acidithiobacillus]MDA8176635.1 HAD-IIIC family phosphatase [Acidithiobacillus sp.]